MPTLTRLLTILAVLAGIIYGIMAALVYLVEPVRREVTVPIELPEPDGAARQIDTEGLSELRR
ncbi:hypothetical protein [Jiella marina]|uniref:hypothetical protein n=1 Tax=Jiella sp. LLJ827 TaxID=2917712 RepID=UPI00210196F1|nr:hypothetical protein [Jiella sp. LLJ827]MCQ0987007.1 hypothetical protein [Jiella sp. LLJ827]